MTYHTRETSPRFAHDSCLPDDLFEVTLLDDFTTGRTDPDTGFRVYDKVEHRHQKQPWCWDRVYGCGGTCEFCGGPVETQEQGIWRPAAPRTAPRIVLNLGMGADSVAEILRFIHEPETRPCPLQDMLVITAMTGNEWPVTGRLMETHILPLFREHGIRYVQVARGGQFEESGIVVLDDSRSPQRMIMAGDWALSDEMISGGTVPQVAGPRRCSIKFKGWVIDRFLETEMDGAPFLQLMGFEANEPGRASQDTRDGNSAQRTGVYPLIEWGWDREQCERYIKQLTGVDWPKSACVFCPFALQNKDGRNRVLASFKADPASGIAALMMERLAVALNPNQGLAKDRQLADILRATGGHTEALRLFLNELNSTTWRLYRVRRVIRGRKDDPSKPANGARKVEALAEGSRGQMLGELEQLAADQDLVLTAGADHVLRAWVRERGDGPYPVFEEFYVAAPAGAADKEGRGFAAAWAALEKAA